MFFLLTRLVAEGQTGSGNIVNAEARKADSINVLGRKFMLAGKRDSAHIFLERALQMAHESGNSTILARSYVDLAGFYIMQSKFVLAKEYLDKGKPFFDQTDNYEIKMAQLMQTATNFNGLNKKDSAIYYYRLAEKYNSDKMPYRNYLVYMALGELYSQMNDLDEAEKYFRKSYELTSREEGKPHHIYLLTVYLNFCLEKKQSGDAGALIAEYNALIEERKRKKIKDPLNNLILSLTGGKIESNQDFLKEIKQKSLSNGFIYDAMVANAFLIKNAEKKKNFDEALQYATENEELVQKTGNLQNIYGTKREKFSLLKKAGKYTEANALAEDLFVLEDSLLLVQKREQLYELEARFETQKKEKEIQLLSSTNLLKQKEIALLLSDNRMAALLLQKEMMERSSLERENVLMDSIVKSEQAYTSLLTSENQFKEDKLKKEKELMQSLTRENMLQAKQVKKERQTKWILASGAAIVLLSGLSIYYLYKKQKTKNSIIQKQASDLEVLMKEIHHRVKNNLQVVSSLLDLQSHTITDVQAHEAIKEGKNRVQSMALIHQNLYRENNIKGIRLKEYVGNLVQTLCDSYNITNDRVRINSNIDDLKLDVDTMIPIGLVLNELVSNSFKYAFKEKQNGELDIFVKESGEKIHLIVKDNGIGFPESIDVKTSKTFGLKMIRAFAQKLKAKLDVYNNNGAVVEMWISKFKTA